MNKIKNTGFTLVELMIVVALIALLAAIAASGATRIRVNTNESSVVHSLKTIQSTATSYRTANATYPANLAALGTAYLSGGLETGTKSGYNFELASGVNGGSYTVTAVPVTPNMTGNNSYCTDTYNAIYVYSGAPDLASNGAACPAGGTIL